jgi:hypothetical protein
MADPTPGNAPPPYVDPNGDGRLSAQDALGVISWLLTHHAAQPQSATSAAQVASGAGPASSTLASDNTIASNPSGEPAAVSFSAESQDAPSAELPVRTITAETGEQPTSSAPESARVLLVQPRYAGAPSRASAKDAALSDSDLLGCAEDGIPVEDALASAVAIRRRTRVRVTA